MIKFKFRAPYKRNGKTNFPESKNRPGVYIIKENEKIVYIGFSGVNLYKTMYRHFQKWHHSQQEVISYKSKLTRNDYTVRIVYCTPRQSEKLEKQLILKYRPRDNSQRYDDYISTKADEKILQNYFEISTEPAPF